MKCSEVESKAGVLQTSRCRSTSNRQGPVPPILSDIQSGKACPQFPDTGDDGAAQRRCRLPAARQAESHTSVPMGESEPNRLSRTIEPINAECLGQRWGVGESWVRNHVRNGCSDMIPHVKLTGRIIFEWGSEALERYWNDRRVGYNAEAREQAAISEGIIDPPPRRVVRAGLDRHDLQRIADLARAAVGPARKRARVSSPR